MSLYTPSSTIRRLILEAEDLTLDPSTQAQQTEQFTDTAASPNDVMADMSAAAPQAPQTPGMPGAALSMPSIAKPQSTVSKTVINRDIILSQLAELKSVITNYEKKFDGDDLTPEDANVYISSLLSTLVFHAERFNDFMGSDSEGGEAAPEAMPELPPESPEMPLESPEMPPAGPEPSPEAPQAEEPLTNEPQV